MEGHLRRLLPFVLLLAAAAGVVLLPIERPPLNPASFDLYAYFYGNTLHALRALHTGAGLLWNPYQNCGQPFFANSLTAMLYPPNALFAVLGLDIGLRAVAIVNLYIGGFGAYLLARELRLDRGPALVAGLAFTLGNSALLLVKWSPMHIAPYVWFPWAMLYCERLLRAPGRGDLAGLAVVLTLALLPGFPQTVLFIYLLIGMRVLWALAARECSHPRSSISAIAVALVLPLLLGAVQLLPSAQLASLSIRSVPVGNEEMRSTSWAALRLALRQRSAHGPFLLISVCVAAASLGSGPGRRRQVGFYAFAAAVFFALAFGPGTPVHDLYAWLPFGRMFRHPQRFLWVVDFCLTVLVGFGAAVLSDRRTGARARRSAALVFPVVIPLAFPLLAGRPLGAHEWVSLAPLAVAYSAAIIPRLASFASPTIAFALLLNASIAASGTVFTLLPSGAALTKKSEGVDALRARLTPQDRVALFPRTVDFSFMEKTATVFRFPAISDYEPQVTRRYADYFALMRTGRPVTKLGDVLYAGLQWLSPLTRRRLLDLTASRYLVTDTAQSNPSAGLGSHSLQPLRVGTEGDLYVYENRSALPRAFLVPRLEVIADRATLQDRLANGFDDLRQVAFVEAPPPSGFLGEATTLREATVTFTADEPEHLRLRVDVPRRSFLFLADQDYPGWQARVNGEPTQILRANYAFRLVEVPAGTSTVEFRFRPSIVLFGAGISLAATLGLAAFVRRPRRTI